MESKREESHWEMIGTFGVDSGQVLITDPCYLSDWKVEEFDDKKVEAMKKSKKFSYSYNGACARTLDDSKNRRGAGSIGKGCDGVVANTGFGDGVYPVYAKFREGRCKELRIIFF